MRELNFPRSDRTATGRAIRLQAHLVSLEYCKDLYNDVQKSQAL